MPVIPDVIRAPSIDWDRRNRCHFHFLIPIIGKRDKRNLCRPIHRNKCGHFGFYSIFFGLSH